MDHEEVKRILRQDPEYVAAEKRLRWRFAIGNALIRSQVKVKALFNKAVEDALDEFGMVEFVRGKADKEHGDPIGILNAK